MKQQFLLDTAGLFRTYIYDNNRKAVPAAASISIYRPEGGALVSDAVMDIAQDGLLSYGLSASDNSIAGLNYKAVISYEHSSEVCGATIFYDVVRSRLSKVITDDDLASELPQLKDRGWSVRGTAEGGTSAAIIDSSLKRFGEDYFTGGTAYCPEKEETREIMDFAASTGTVSVEDFSAPVTAGEKYILTRSFSREIQRAFEKLEDRMVRMGRRPELVLDPYDLREAHIMFSAAEACKGQATESRGIWWDLWKEYEKKAEEAVSKMAFKYDSSEDGFVSAGESVTLSLTAGRQ